MSRCVLDIKKQLESREEDIIGFLVGNKKDLEKTLQKNSAKAQELAAEMGLE